MTKIHKKKSFTEINYTEPKERFCLYCIKYNIRIKLTRRPNYEEVDKDMWLYCKNCHRAFLENETRMEGRLKPMVDAKMYEDERTIMGLDNLDPKDKDAKRKALRERIAKETDPDVITLLKQGYDIKEEQYNSGR